MSEPTYLIVNADDFGQSAGVNRGIIEAHEHGIVTSASLMVRWPAALEAAQYACMHPNLGVGLHFDFGEWRYDGGAWKPLYEVVPLDEPEAVSQEVARQLDTFRMMLGTDPTHLDSHQHVHRREPVRTVVRRAGEALGIPVRHETPTVRYCGAFYGQADDGTPLPEAISVDALIHLIATLPPGSTEMACHPALDDGLITMYRRERIREVETLCNPRVKAVLLQQGVILRSFRERQCHV